MEENKTMVDEFFSQADRLTSDVLVQAAPSATCNGALAIQQAGLSHGSLTDRLFELYQQYRLCQAQDAVHLESKFVIFHVTSVYRTVVEIGLTRCLAEWSINFTPEQMQQAEFFIFVFENCPDHIALVSSRVLNAISMGITNDGRLTIGRATFIGALRMSVPYQVFPWMVPYSRLNECFLDIIASADNSGTNPLSFIVTQGWFLKVAGFKNLMPIQELLASFEQMSKIHAAFKASRYGLSLELMSSQADGDFMLCEKSLNLRPFVIKYRYNHFQRYETFNDYLSLVLHSADAGRTFDSHAQFDYFWADTSDGYGYLIPRDRIPADWKDSSKVLSDWFHIAHSPLSDFRIEYIGDFIRKILEILSRHQRPSLDFEMFNNGALAQEVLGDLFISQDAAEEGLAEDVNGPRVQSRYPEL